MLGGEEEGRMGEERVENRRDKKKGEEGRLILFNIMIANLERELEKEAIGGVKVG